MITLHDVYEQGSAAVKAAVESFGGRHPLEGVGWDAGPDWKRAEKHFTDLIAAIMGTAAPPQTGFAAIVSRAENAAVDFLLAVNSRPDYRCPICAKEDRLFL
ncbi:hypothetical protein ACIP79_41730 [Streptomyces sp. NPDC088747]|uniref:hypothetical protein n=1 Tax=Streptomyces sp. NPDC088747 TaxID=3365886 RepID=UPI00380E6508